MICHNTQRVNAVKSSSPTGGHLGDWQKLSVQRRRNRAEFLSLVKPIPVTKRSVLYQKQRRDVTL